MASLKWYHECNVLVSLFAVLLPFHPHLSMGAIRQATSAGSFYGGFIFTGYSSHLQEGAKFGNTFSGMKLFF